MDKITRRITKIEQIERVEINRKDLLNLVGVPTKFHSTANVFVAIPGGGNWSNTNTANVFFDINNDFPVCVEWKYTEEFEGDAEVEGI